MSGYGIESKLVKRPVQIPKPDEDGTPEATSEEKQADNVDRENVR